MLGQVVIAAPYNNIAKKNLARLSQLESTPVPAKPESTEGGRRVSVLKWQEDAPVLLG